MDEGKTPRLSLCVPTWNQAHTLPALLESVLAQDDIRIEIVVRDNASTDDTAAVCAEYARRCPRLRYTRNEANLGFCLNALTVALDARGDFIWFVGADDALEAGALKAVLTALDAHPDVGGMCTRYLHCDETLQVVHATGDPAAGRIPDTRRIDSAREVFLALGRHFGFFSIQILRRDLFREIYRDGGWTPFLYAFIHAYFAAEAARRSGAWVYLAVPCVRYRSGDDLGKGGGDAFERVLVDAEWYPRLIARTAPDPATAKAVIAEAVGASARHMVVPLRRAGALSAGQRVRALLACAGLVGGCRTYWTALAPALLAPRPVLGRRRR